MQRPNSNEHAPYYSRYISLVPDGNIIEILTAQLNDIEKLLSSISEEKSKYRYAENKWSIREVVGHIIDAERIFAYRALRFARNDKTEISGFEQNDYVPNSNHDNIPLTTLLDELLLLRKANLLFFKSLTDEMWLRSGIASNNLITVRAIAYVMAGHCIHHIDVIKNKYL